MQRTASGQIDWRASLAKGLPLCREQLVYRTRYSAPPVLWLVLLDASASTRRGGALSQAKGVVQGVLAQAYRQRATVAVLTLSGGVATWQYQGRRVAAQAPTWLVQQGSGGGTPLAEGLVQARAWLVQRQKRHPHETQRLLVLTDGRIRDMQGIAPLPCETQVVDMECSPVRLGRARLLAQHLGATYCLLEALAPQA